MKTSTIQLFQLLKTSIGEKAAQAMIEFTDHRVEESLQENDKILASREDIARLETKISEKHTDMLKWLIVLLIGQLAAMPIILKLAGKLL